jgi:hypothetical protein
MRLRSVILCLAVVASMSVACARSPEPGLEGASDSTAGAAPDTTARAQLLVQELPTGIEGLELAERGLRVKKGYEYVKDTDSTFAIMRLSDNGRITVGGCGCKAGAGCVPFLTDDGIIICVSVLCNTCGLAVTSPGGQRFEIARYEKPY